MDVQYSQKIISCYKKISKKIYFYGSPLLLLAIRLWIARIFYFSGLTKIANWDATLYLFQNEYKVPMLSYHVAAQLATLSELCCPILLLLGLATRLAVLPLIAMTLVIQFTYDPALEHFYWLLLLFTIFIVGPGKISLDYWIVKKYPLG